MEFESGSLGTSMPLEISAALLEELHRHVEEAYPGEGAGFLLGQESEGQRVVQAILKLPNAREEAARFNRFLLTAEDFMKGEMEAERSGLNFLGVFHSHPDCPNRPSEFDREWAMPWFSYIITRVNGQDGPAAAVSDLSWRLQDDRASYAEEELWVRGAG
jgi:proteasome lid subunit RPN8/RPN11